MIKKKFICVDSFFVFGFLLVFFFLFVCLFVVVVFDSISSIQFTCTLYTVFLSLRRVPILLEGHLLVIQELQLQSESYSCEVEQEEIRFHLILSVLRF